ncbi:hypothetical protein KAJ89_02445 [Candidatus Parcubacteria bacterium]|nr:hypothetical protein [Candidatus Parcubacteria bacterium]
MKIIITLLLLFILYPLNVVFAEILSDRLKGKILLQVESRGEAWYVNPDNQKKYYLGRPTDAFNIMRKLGLGISNSDFDLFDSSKTPVRLSGKILLKVEDGGKAYYVNPDDLKMYYLGRPSDAFQIMRNLGLGISNVDINTIQNHNNEEPVTKNTQIISSEDTNTTESASTNTIISDEYLNAIVTLINEYLNSYYFINTDADTFISAIEQRIKILNLKSSTLMSLTAGQEQNVAKLILNLKTVQDNDVKSLEYKIYAIEELIKINNTRKNILENIVPTIESKGWTVNEDSFVQITDGIYHHGDYLAQAEYAISKGLDNFKNQMDSKDEEYRAYWNQIQTLANIVYYNPPTYSGIDFSPTYRPSSFKCYINRNFSGLASSINCY